MALGCVSDGAGVKTTALRTIVVDPDASALARTRGLLRYEPDIEIVGECATAPHAHFVVEDTRPDLVFLEVNVPQLDGIEFARSLTRDGSAVVFVTAHHDYAASAFETRAVDYVLKPFSDERFMVAVNRARLHLGAAWPHRARFDARQSSVPEHRSTPRRRLLVKSDGRVNVLRTRDIEWCEAVGNYVRLHVGSHTHMMRVTLTYLEGQLDSRQFVRVHRSTIVNIDHIRELTSSANGEYELLLHDQTELTLSRGYRRRFEDVLDDSL
jgi:two-component system LytT family response regulator